MPIGVPTAIMSTAHLLSKSKYVASRAIEIAAPSFGDFT